MTPQMDIFVRFLIFLLSAETGVRYLTWYMRVYNTRPPEPLRELMLGIGVGQLATAISVGHSVTAIVAFHAGFWSSPIQEWSGLSFAMASFLCLIPCWRISCKFGPRAIVVTIALHLTVAYIGAQIIGVLPT